MLQLGLHDKGQMRKTLLIIFKKVWSVC